MSQVRHGNRLYKQMSLEVAVRNPERYYEFLKTFSHYKGTILDDEGILEIFAQLYAVGVISTRDIDVSSTSIAEIKSFIKTHISHNNEWGYPTGYQAGFTRYLKTLSEFGFIYAQYKQPLKLSEVAEAIINGKITLSEAFALQSLRFWRKSPYRRVLNDYNFFRFILDVIKRRNDNEHKLSYPQFMLSLFSDDGNVESFINQIESNKTGNSLDDTYALAVKTYNSIDENHAKICKQQTAFNDYGNTVFRVLQLTGFVTVEYKGLIMLSINSNRSDFYRELCAMNFQIPEDAKEDQLKYFNTIGTLTPAMLNCIVSNRDLQRHSVDSYNEKLESIVETYNLDEELLANYLKDVSVGVSDSRVFWYMQVPLKFEFLLSLYLFVCYKDEYEYKPNYVCDDAGIPYSHAPGNIGDIEVYNDDFYWLIEATLIKNKNQQINNETINLFRHIDETKPCTKYLSLVAPFIHDDTELLIKVATVVTMIEKKSLLFAKPYTIDDFISVASNRKNREDIQDYSFKFIGELGKMLTFMKGTFDRL